MVGSFNVFLNNNHNNNNNDNNNDNSNNNSNYNDMLKLYSFQPNL